MVRSLLVYNRDTQAKPLPFVVEMAEMMFIP